MFKNLSFICFAFYHCWLIFWGFWNRFSFLFLLLSYHFLAYFLIFQYIFVETGWMRLILDRYRNFVFWNLQFLCFSFPYQLFVIPFFFPTHLWIQSQNWLLLLNTWRKNLFFSWNVKTLFQLWSAATQIYCNFACVDTERKRVSFVHTVTMWRTFGHLEGGIFWIVDFVLLNILSQVNLKVFQVFGGLLSVLFQQRNKSFFLYLDIFPQN